MPKPFQRISENREKAVVEWAARSFAGSSTFRMFAKNHSENIRKFLQREIGNCSDLSRSHTRAEYTQRLLSCISKFRSSSIRMNSRSKNRGRRPGFGQAAKVINLYIKQYLLRPDFMGRRQARAARRLYKFAHVPLDRIVLGRVWEDFQRELSKNGIGSQPKMSRLQERDYSIIQEVIYRNARATGLPPIAYDFNWAERSE